MSAWLPKLLAVAAGGALGATLRFLAAHFTHAWLGFAFPWGTLLVNVLGSAAIGYLFVLLPEVPEPAPLLRLLLITGLLGGFTTFSAFSIETLQLLQAGWVARATGYAGAMLALCLAGVWGGFLLGRALHAGT
jgi:CrcB protein